MINLFLIDIDFVTKLYAKLYICVCVVTKGIVDLHGGRISVRSEGEGLGCTFTVDLPVYVHTIIPSSRNSRIYHRRSILGAGHTLSPEDATSGANDLLSLPVHAHDSVFPFTTSQMVASNTSSRSGSVSIRGIDGSAVDLRNAASTTARASAPQSGRIENPSPSQSEYLLSSEDRPIYEPSSSSVTFSMENLMGSASKVDIRLPSPLSNQPELYPGPGSEGIAVGLGTHFLPNTATQSDIETSTVEERKATECLTNVMPIRVLVVDDAYLNRKMMSRLLRGHCESVGEACDGQDALAKVRLGEEENRPYNVILMDYQMPNLDGPGAARQLRSNGYVGLIIGITGMTAGTDMEEFRAAGADCVLTKPVNTQDLEPIFQGE